jgi:acetyl-CoA carboxylase carboxyltransferase component
MHSQISGTVDFYEESDESCIKQLRKLVDLLPKKQVTVPGLAAPPKTGTVTYFSARDAQEVCQIVSTDGRTEYDAHDLLNCIIDADSLVEYKSDYGKSLVCAYASIGGTNVGIIANQHTHTKSPKGELQIGGVIYHESADKAARFIMDCNQTQIPIVFFQDVQGFMVGRDSEQNGIIRSGAKLVNAVSNSTVPKITVVIGGSFGAGNYALCGKAFDPVFIFAWPSARYAVMGADQAAGTLVQIEQRQAERGGKKLSQDDIEQLRERIVKDYQEQTDIRYGAARGWVDAIIAPHETRDVLIRALELATRPPPPGGFRAGVLQV